MGALEQVPLPSILGISKESLKGAKKKLFIGFSLEK
jgi:hypothetical protein